MKGMRSYLRLSYSVKCFRAKTSREKLESSSTQGLLLGSILNSGFSATLENVSAAMIVGPGKFKVLSAWASLLPIDEPVRLVSKLSV
jgi:hypothetical protein